MKRRWTGRWLGAALLAQRGVALGPMLDARVSRPLVLSDGFALNQALGIAIPQSLLLQANQVIQ